MQIRKLFIANRGEIALRIARGAAEAGIETVAVCAADDADCLHARRADDLVRLDARGARAYLDMDALVDAAKTRGADAVHPGYGFLAESAEFCRRVEAAGLVFVGPTSETLELLGDKARARAFAESADVNLLRGTTDPVDAREAGEFLDALGPGAAVVLKAVAGGGGRGMRIVSSPDDLDAAFERAASEARAAFGEGSLYVERFLAGARHIEVQVVGDGSGAAVHLGERECTLQRRHQKLVEIAPSPFIGDDVRWELWDAAVRMAAALDYRGVGTFEFLVDAGGREWAFIEANARLQVEHTVTEEVTGVDLVAVQLALAGGAGLDALGLDGEIEADGTAVQLRVNAETVDGDGNVRPSGGTVAVFEPPTGPGVRTDSHAYGGYPIPAAYDSLLAKIIVHSAGDWAQALGKARRALGELRIDGVATNAGFLAALLDDDAVATGDVHTRFVDDRVGSLAAAAERDRQQLAPASGATPNDTTAGSGDGGSAAPDVAASTPAAGASVDASDPLAVLAYGSRENRGADAAPAATTADTSLPVVEIDDADGAVVVRSPLQGTVVSVEVASGDCVAAGATVVVMEAMKMEHVVAATGGGTVRAVHVQAGDTVYEGHAFAVIEPSDVGPAEDVADDAVDLDAIRPDLAEAAARHGFGDDENRPESVARRRKTGQRTARENIDDLCDDGSFIEYGALAFAAQQARRSVDELIRRTPADGLVCGIGSVGGEHFPPERARAVVLAYDYTVLAGTQGLRNHQKKDRMFEIAAEQRLPVVLFTEGGGGRPGDTDGSGVAGLDCMAFHLYGKLSGLVPLVGINSGRCFAGNAALLGSSDVVIATRDSNIGMGGPAMIEGGGLGVFRPEEVGPIDVQVAGGVVDIAVDDEAEAVAVAKQYLSYFQGAVTPGEVADQRLLRAAVPENRKRIYDVRRVVDVLADAGSVLELRRGFGHGMVTALARIEGRPIGIVANNPEHLAGAIDPPGADKAARFLQLCDAFDLPVLFLCDTPGIMVGPEIEKQAMVRHASRLFVVGANLSVPFFTIVLRKGYGLGAQTMAGGSFHAPVFTVAWPTGEFGGMGLEGAVKLGFRKELEAIDDPAERARAFEERVARMYEVGKALNFAAHMEIDDVIDPADSRRWIVAGLESAPPPAPRTGKKRPCVDAW